MYIYIYIYAQKHIHTPCNVSSLSTVYFLLLRALVCACSCTRTWEHSLTLEVPAAAEPGCIYTCLFKAHACRNAHIPSILRQFCVPFLLTFGWTLTGGWNGHRIRRKIWDKTGKFAILCDCDMHIRTKICKEEGNMLESKDEGTVLRAYASVHCLCISEKHAYPNQLHSCKGRMRGYVRVRLC